MADDRPLAHIVYFTLRDGSAAASKRLVESCGEHLAGHEGTLHFSAGTLAAELTRDVNDRDFHVALHVLFESRAAHDRYQSHPRHLRFIEENKASWARVRVFDSYLDAIDPPPAS